MSSPRPTLEQTAAQESPHSARLEHRDEAQKAFAAALRSDDKTLAAAILGRALGAGWSSVVAEYVKQHPAAGDDLADLAKLQQYNSFEAGLSYIVM